MLTITTQARAYALRELARRACVEMDLFQRWRIELTPKVTRLWVLDGKYIDFPNASSDFWRDVNRGIFGVERASWPFPADSRLFNRIPDFVVPFADRPLAGPLFEITEDGNAVCAVDLLSSIWLTLSRFEETLPGERDVHGRFTAAQSIASQHSFLDRPVIDELGLAFEQVLKAMLPGWQPRERELQVKVSHDIDVIGIPWNPRTILGHVAKRGKVTAALRDLAASLTNVAPSYLQAVLQVTELASDHGLQPAVYWKANEIGPFDSAYSLRHPKVARVVSALRDAGVEMGVHPGYKTFLAPLMLKREVDTLRQVISDQQLGGRQHFLRWSPATWRHWEDCGLAYDSTVGFAEHIGFRAGTCIPYRPWLLEDNREARLLEIPLVVMDGTLTVYMRLGRSEALEAARIGIERCRMVGGVFAFLWHNHTILDPDLNWLYRHILALVGGAKTFDWKAEQMQSIPLRQSA